MAATTITGARRWILSGLLVAVAAWGWPSSARSFYNTKIGDRVDNASLATLDGKKAKLLGKARVNVFIFFRTDQEYSGLVLGELAALEKKLSGKAVRWVAIASSTYPLADTRALIKKSKLKMPVLIDKGDKLYGKIGVVLHPVVGIADQNHKLVAYLPFRKINYQRSIEAEVLFAAGVIDDATRQRMQNPEMATDGGNSAVANRNFNLAASLFKLERYEAALKTVRKSVKLDAKHAPSQGLLAAILAKTGDCKAALAAAKVALNLQSDQEHALQAREICK